MCLLKFYIQLYCLGPVNKVCFTKYIFDATSCNVSSTNLQASIILRFLVAKSCIHDALHGDARDLLASTK